MGVASNESPVLVLGSERGTIIPTVRCVAWAVEELLAEILAADEAVVVSGCSDGELLDEDGPLAWPVDSGVLDVGFLVFDECVIPVWSG